MEPGKGCKGVMWKITTFGKLPIWGPTRLGMGTETAGLRCRVKGLRV